MSWQPGEIVWLQFPFVEIGTLKARPCVVLNSAPLGPDGDLIWAAMITGAAKSGWPGDVVISDHAAAGLPIPSIVRRAKLATLAGGSARHVGHLAAADLTAVLSFLKATLPA